MRIHIAKYEPSRTGGGWAFQNNFAKGIALLSDFVELSSYEDADVYFIAGASMVDKEEVRQAKSDGKKVVLRVDNMPRRSRNRRWIDDNGKTKIQIYAEIADVVIYQSEWARGFLEPFLGVSGPVVINGVDTKLFNPDNRQAPDDSYLYARSSRDEGKQWIMAWYWFSNNPGTLEIVGQFSHENIDHNFDFVNGERYRFMGVQEHMQDVYKRNRYFLYTYTNDACSNTLIEALASGCEIIDVYGQLATGGAPEIMACGDLSLERMTRQYLEAMV